MPSNAGSLFNARRRFKDWLRHRRRPWQLASYGGVRVHYKKSLDGGGTRFGQEFVPFFERLGIPKQQRVFEWCAGPAFIGFSLLGHGLCAALCLADINPIAVAACRRTIADNRLDGQVSVYRSNNLSAIPPDERWDMVVGNPPHFDNPVFHRLDNDNGWQIHRAFFGSVSRFLRKSGVIVLQEHKLGSTAETFREMIEAAGLTVVFVDGAAPGPTETSSIYFIGIIRRGDPAPDWVKGAAAVQQGHARVQPPDRRHAVGAASSTTRHRRTSGLDLAPARQNGPLPPPAGERCHTPSSPAWLPAFAE